MPQRSKRDQDQRHGDYFPAGRREGQTRSHNRLRRLPDRHADNRWVEGPHGNGGNLIGLARDAAARGPD
jgi:hypothetical protein